MAKNVLFGISDTARKAPKMYFGISDVARKIVKGYIGINDVARQFYTAIVDVAMTISGTGNASGCYVSYNNSTYYTSGSTFSAAAGSTVILHIKGRSGGANASYISIDNTTVVTVATNTPTDYSWTVPNNITGANIVLQNNYSYAYITVTTF